MNIAEILKDCPRGTKLYSPVSGEVSLDRIDRDYDEYPILVYTSKGKECFTLDGRFYYACEDGECMLFPSKENRDWSTFKAPKKKYDFKPFAKVLVRDSDDEPWRLNLFSHFVDTSYKYVCLVAAWAQCIPYEGNEHLLGVIKKVPDNCELKQDGNTYIVVEEEKNNITYKDVAKKLFEDNYVCYFDECGTPSYGYTNEVESPNHCTSKKQTEKLLAINQLMNVAKYLNGDWQPDWKRDEVKYYIQIDTVNNELCFGNTSFYNGSIVYFKSKELMKQAIEILGKYTILLALCTDY